LVASADLGRRGFLGLMAGLAVATAGHEQASAAAVQAPAEVAATAQAVDSFYLSAAGNDAADGRSPASAWASIPRLNAAMAGGVVRPGAAVRFRAGDTFYGRVQQPGHRDVTAPWTVFTSYGVGARPVISAYKVANRSAGWVNRGNGVWRIDLRSRSGAYTGDVTSDKTDVGFLKVDGVIYGRKRSRLTDLRTTWDFVSTDGFCYVKVAYNPATRHDTKIAVSGAYTDSSGSPDIFTPMTKTALIGLDIAGCGGNGIVGSAYWRPQQVQIRNCAIREIGGSYLPGYANGQVRYGNGIQAWLGQSDWLVEQCEISDCYDAAVTYQGSQDGATGGSSRLHARNNTIWGCCQSFELWSEGTDGPGFSDCSFTDNVCVGAGRSWGQAVRPDADGRGCHVLLYQLQLPTDVSVERNVFLGAATNYVFALDGIPKGLRLRGNAVYLGDQVPLQTSTVSAHQLPHTINQASQWQAVSGQESGSVFFREPTPAATAPQAMAFLSTQTALPAGVVSMLGSRVLAAF
jgi:hypothetical protein